MPNQAGVSDTSKKDALTSTSTPSKTRLIPIRMVMPTANQDEETRSFTQDRSLFEFLDILFGSVGTVTLERIFATWCDWAEVFAICSRTKDCPAEPSRFRSWALWELFGACQNVASVLRGCGDSLEVLREITSCIKCSWSLKRFSTKLCKSSIFAPKVSRSWPATA